MSVTFLCSIVKAFMAACSSVEYQAQTHIVPTELYLSGPQYQSISKEKKKAYVFVTTNFTRKSSIFGL